MQRIRKTLKNFIDWSGGYFQTDMSYIVRSGFWLSIGQGIAIVLAFFLSVLFANYVSKENYGTYRFVLSAAGLLGVLSLSGMGSVVVQAVAQGKEGVLREAIQTSLKWSIVIVCAATFSAAYYAINGNTIIALSLLIAGLLMPLTNAYSLYLGFLNGRKDFKASTLYWCASQTFINVCIAAAIFLSGNVLTLVLSYFAANTIASLVAFRLVSTRYKPNTETEPSMISYGKHISAMNLLSGLANQIDKLLVFHFIGGAGLAVYSFAFAIPEQIKGSYKNLLVLAIPKYASQSLEEIKRSILKKIVQLTGITALVVVSYILLAPMIYQFFFPKYTDAIFYSQLYMLGLLAIPGITLTGAYFQIKKETKLLYRLNIIYNVTTFFLALVLVSRFGVLGAVIENGLSWACMLGLNLYYFFRDK